MKTKNQSTKMSMTFLESAYRHMYDTVGLLAPESGGILLGNRDDYIIRKFYFDRSARTSGSAYDPDLDYLNKVVKKEWQENNLAFLGFIHSHPKGCSHLSGNYDSASGIGDLSYIAKIFNAMPELQKFLSPIVFSDSQGKFEIFPYIAFRENPQNYQQAKLEILDDISFYNYAKNYNLGTKIAFNTDRLSGSVDIELMKKTHIVCVGIGGANQICENFVRSGLGKLTVIDFDVVDSKNLSVQGYYLQDIGLPKVESLGNRLKNINPDLNYYPINADFLKMTSNEIADIIKDADLLMLMTDNFYAQAKGNKVGIKYKIPTIFAIMYEKARCSEITFTIPGVTPACHRCAVSSRYKSYSDGYKNDIQSTGSTIFQTQYLNSAIGMLSLAILHRDTTGLEFSNWFGQNFERNLVQLRTHPEYSNEEGKLFRKNLNGKRFFNFDSIWQEIEPESHPKYTEPCPDCLGLSDLRLSSKIISLYENTKVFKTLSDFNYL